MVLKELKWTYCDAYLWQTMWNHAKTINGSSQTANFCVFTKGHQWLPIVKTLNLKVWTLPLIFLHDFTLFVIDMHQKRSISLFPTPSGHFHFHPFPALIWWVDLRRCHTDIIEEIHFWKILFWKTVEKMQYAPCANDQIQWPVRWTDRPTGVGDGDRDRDAVASKNVIQVIFFE